MIDDFDDIIMMMGDRAWRFRWWNGNMAWIWFDDGLKPMSDIIIIETLLLLLLTFDDDDIPDDDDMTFYNPNMTWFLFIYYYWC